MLYQCLHLHKTRSMFINEILGPEITVDQAVQMAANRKQWSLNSKLRCENLRNRMGTNSGRNCEVGDHTRRRSKRSLTVEQSFGYDDRIEGMESANVPAEKRVKFVDLSEC